MNADHGDVQTQLRRYASALDAEAAAASAQLPGSLVGLRTMPQPRNIKRVAFAAGALAVAVLAGTALLIARTDRSDSTTTATRAWDERVPETLKGTWLVTAWSGPLFGEMQPADVAGLAATIAFSDDRVDLYDGCNHASTPVSYSQTALRVDGGEMVSTLVGCSEFLPFTTVFQGEQGEPLMADVNVASGALVVTSPDGSVSFHASRP